MTPYINPRNHVAILVGDVLYLPDGRPVPFDEVTGWEEADDVEPAPACLAAAQAAQAVLDARPMSRPVSRPLPVLEAPRAWKEAPEVAAFRARVAKVRAVVEPQQPSRRRALWLDVLDRFAAMSGAPTIEAEDAVRGIAACADGVLLDRLAAEVAPVLAWADALDFDALPPRKTVAQAARRLNLRLRTRGWVLPSHVATWEAHLDTWRRLTGRGP